MLIGSRWMPMVLAAGMGALGGCNVPPPSSQSAVGTRAVVLDNAACAAPVATNSNFPIIRDAMLRLENGMAVLTGCVINPGPNAYRDLGVEAAFFDQQGHLLNSVGEGATYLPPYAAPPASATGLPRWMQPFDVQSYSNAAQAEILLDTVICAPDGRTCSEEHETAVVPRSAP